MIQTMHPGTAGAHFVKFLLILIGLSFFQLVQLHAQSVILQEFHSDEPSSDMEDLLFLYAGVPLSRAGYSSIRDKAQAEYILDTYYEVKQDSADIRYILYDRRDETVPLSEYDFTLALDFTAYRQIADALGHLLENVEQPEGGETKGEIVGIVPRLGRTEDDFEGVDPNAAGQQAVSPPYFESRVAVPMYYFLGDARDLFHYGAGANLELGRAYPSEGMGYGLGARAGFCYPITNPDVVGGALYMTTAGPRFSLFWGGRDKASLGGDAVAGAALMMLSTGPDTLSNVAPYAEINLNADFPVSPVFHLGLDAGYYAVFDRYLIISGLKAALVLELNLY